MNANGFIAQTLQDERPVPGLYVDQLVLFQDVTDEVIDEINKGTTDEERAKFEKDVISKD
ncbi:MAG: S46 family peptidase [Ignavibacteriales bacterium]|nr:S46 family peptidase [Ignavibacteriales bacterium]